MHQNKITAVGYGKLEHKLQGRLVVGVLAFLLAFIPLALLTASFLASK